METPIVTYADPLSVSPSKTHKASIPHRKIKVNLLSQLSNNTNNIVVINNFINNGRRPSKKKNSRTNVKETPKKRCDINGNEIKKKGKHKISFVDKITKKRLVDAEEIESFKQYNIVEDVVNEGNHHSCCIVY